MMGDSYVICSCQFNNSVTGRVEKRKRMREVINFIQSSIFCESLSQISSSEISKTTHCLGLGLYVSNVKVYGINAAHEDA